MRQPSMTINTTFHDYFLLTICKKKNRESCEERITYNKNNLKFFFKPTPLEQFQNPICIFGAQRQNRCPLDTFINDVHSPCLVLTLQQNI